MKTAWKVFKDIGSIPLLFFVGGIQVVRIYLILLKDEYKNKIKDKK